MEAINHPKGKISFTCNIIQGHNMELYHAQPHYYFNQIPSKI